MSAPRPSLGFRPADALSLDDLTVLWREIYANYPVPLPYTEDELARFIARSGIGLGLSQIAIVDGAPVGLSLAARAADAAWIGGFGVIDSHRRTGVGLALARHQCRQLEDAGVAAMRLEVMAANPARCLYAAAGFVDRRLLFSFNSPAVGCGGADPLVLLQPEQLPALHRRLHVGAGGAPWQREIEGVMRAAERDRLTLLGWTREGRVAAYAAELTSGGVSQLIDAAAEDDRAAEALVSSLASRQRGRRLSLGDEPAASPIARAFRRFGAVPRTQRYEMLRLGRAASVSEPRVDDLAAYA